MEPPEDRIKIIAGVDVKYLSGYIDIFKVKEVKIWLPKNFWIY